MPGDRGSQDLLVLVRVHTVPGAKSNGIMLVEEYDFNRNSCIEGPWRGGVNPWAASDDSRPNTDGLKISVSMTSTTHTEGLLN